MFQFILFSLFLCCNSASYYYPEQHYGYNKFFNGLKKGGIDSYNSGWPQYGHNYGYGYDNGHGHGHGHGHGYGYGVKHQRPYYHRKYLPPIIKRLPPIYKDVKQPVFIEQPVIIRKIPVIHQKKEVTIKKLPPIIKEKPPTFVEKEFGVNPEIHTKPIIDMEKPKDVMPVQEMPQENFIPGVDYIDESKSEMPVPQAQTGYELDKSITGMTKMNEVLAKDMKREEMKDKMPMIETEDDGIGPGDFNEKDFESKK